MKRKKKLRRKTSECIQRAGLALEHLEDNHGRATARSGYMRLKKIKVGLIRSRPHTRRRIRIGGKQKYIVIEVPHGPREGTAVRAR